MDIKRGKLILLLALLASLISCNERKSFQFIVQEESGISFNNRLEYTQELNPYTYRNYYNGAGVAIGDLNNDGLDDIYFAGNQVDNELYKNLGDLKFERIAPNKNISCIGSWSTGVSLVDINADGLLDLYVCKAGPPDGPNRNNQLFINKGNFKFEDESAKYGLDIRGFSIHASFFDYDQDGDLDCYLLNNSIKSVGGYDLRKDQRDIATRSGNKLLSNENGVFVDRSDSLGIYTSDIGFGLGVVASDFNDDGWIDIYVANDFFERDYYYLNNEGKGFIESGEEYFNAFSLGSMGVDASDLDNDGDLDIFVAEMAPKGESRKKTKATYESWDKYNRAVKNGYYHQFPRNMLHLKNEDGYIDISRMKGMDATEWSWAPLIFDMNNDGYKDLFISNGVGKDLLDRDYMAYMADKQRISDLVKNESNKSLKALIDIMPSQKVHNGFFIQTESFDFLNRTELASNMNSSFSNGSGYSDLDNDGDLDLVISNIGDPAIILNNTSSNNSTTIRLIGDEQNLRAIGAKVELYSKGNRQSQTNMPFRGFQSTVSDKLVFGLGSETKIDSVVVLWSKTEKEKFIDIVVNDLNVLQEGKGRIASITDKVSGKLTITELSSYEHSGSIRQFNEFNKEKLLPHMLPKHEPLTVVGDLNSDNNIDFIIGGSQNVESRLILSTEKGSYSIDEKMLKKSFRSDVTEMKLFDSDNDGDLDLYVGHGSRVFSNYATELNDVFYVNNKGVLSLKQGAFVFPNPFITGAVETRDYNNDGFQDLIIGERFSNDIYGSPSTAYIYINNKDNTFSHDSGRSIDSKGMIGDLVKDDKTNSIILSGEWNEIVKYTLENREENGLAVGERGMWYVLELADLDNDGDKDIVAGNVGLNSMYEKGMKLYVADFDRNGRSEQVITTQEGDKEYLVHDFDELTSQIPDIQRRILSYADYGSSSITEVFDSKVLESALKMELEELRSGYYINESGSYSFYPFPEEVQYSSIHAIEVDDLNEDGVQDVLLGGNDYLYKPQYGRNDASSGHLLVGAVENGVYNIQETASLNIKGEIRSIEKIDQKTYLFGINGEPIKKYRIDYE